MLRPLLLFCVLLNTEPLAAQLIQSQAEPCPRSAHYPVTLTFDDGPREPHTSLVLDELKKKGLKASFMLTAEHFPSLVDGRRKPSEYEKKLIRLVQRMKAEGHTVGLHSYEHLSHADTASVSLPKAQENIRKAHAVAGRLGLARGAPFRFPNGSGWLEEQDPANQRQAEKVMRQVVDLGYRPVHWDVDVQDWSVEDRTQLPGSMLDEICLHHGGVILMHDVLSFTADNLGSLIDSIQLSGHRIVSLPELESHADALHRPASLQYRASGLYNCANPPRALGHIWSDCHEFSRLNDVNFDSRPGTDHPMRGHQ